MLALVRKVVQGIESQKKRLHQAKKSAHGSAERDLRAATPFATDSLSKHLSSHQVMSTLRNFHAQHCLRQLDSQRSLQDSAKGARSQERAPGERHCAKRDLGATLHDGNIARPQTLQGAASEPLLLDVPDSLALDDPLVTIEAGQMWSTPESAELDEG